MCGIFGFLSPLRTDLELNKINDLIRHRGPDDAGIYQDDNIALASRRLSIIDLEGGHQPICNEDEGLWLVCNGEIVNSPELRRHLESKGHIFRSKTDVEVILHGYEEWDQAVIERLRGMFAFALWDAPRKRLFLGCDRFGIKPLCYAVYGDCFSFSSEILPILTALPALPRSLNRQAVWRLLEVGFIPPPISAFENIFRLPAGHAMIVENGEYTISRYWKPSFQQQSERQELQFAQAVEGFMERLMDAVRAWKLSDVPIGSLLSGGIDSSSLAAILTEVQNQSIHTFNLAFQQHSLDESSFARETANFLNSQHHEVLFTPNSYDALPDVIRRLEAPRTLTSLSLYLIFKACHELGFKSVMSGEGADELLGGYPWYRMDMRLRPFFKSPKSLRALAAQASIIKSPDYKRLLRSGGARVTERYPFWLRGSDQPEIVRLLHSDPPDPFSELLDAEFGSEIRGLNPFDQMLFIESQTRLVDYINYELDRMSMSFSVEARPPFLDHLLWDYTTRLPNGVKLTPQQDKALLRTGMYGRLPSTILNKPKRGLSNPQISWWRTRRLPDWVEEQIQPGRLSQAGYFNPDEVGRLRTEHIQGIENHSDRLSIVLTTQLWDEIFLRSLNITPIYPA